MKKFFTVVLLIVSVNMIAQQTKQAIANNLPENFPVPEILLSDDPSPGYFFISPAGLWGYFEEASPYLVIMDNYGVPIFYQEQTRAAFDLKLQENNILSYAWGTNGNMHYIFNNKLEYIGEYITSPYGNDFHDLQVFENGDYLTLLRNYRIVDMDTVVEGGHKGVTIVDGVIRLFNSNGELLFNWSTKDHFKITDTRHADLLDPYEIDFAHINSIEMIGDSAILLSSRNMDEVTRISMETGDIIWRLGGNNNQFTFEDDSLVFSAQHDARITSEGYLSLFDNNWQTTLDHESRLIIYDLDEENMTTSLVRDIRSRPEPIHGWIMGNGQELDNGNYIVGWGSGDPNVTEFKPDNTKAFEMRYDAVSYRAYKFDWKSQAFTFNSDEANFDTVRVGETTTIKLELTNNRQDDAVINYIHHYDNQFSVLNQMPINLASGVPVEIEFAIDPEEEGLFEDLFTLCWDTQTDGLNQRIATQINITANALNDLSVKESWKDLIRVYPNPFEHYLMIEQANNDIKIEVCKLVDAFGRDVFEMKSGLNQNQRLEFGYLPQGIYFLIIETDKGSVERKLIRH